MGQDPDSNSVLPDDYIQMLSGSQDFLHHNVFIKWNLIFAVAIFRLIDQGMTSRIIRSTLNFCRGSTYLIAAIETRLLLRLLHS